MDTNHALGLEEVELDSEAELMKSMGLPLRFGGQSAHRDFVVNLYLLYLFCLCSVSRPRDVLPLSYSEMAVHGNVSELPLSCLHCILVRAHSTLVCPGCKTHLPPTNRVRAVLYASTAVLLS